MSTPAPDRDRGVPPSRRRLAALGAVAVLSGGAAASLVSEDGPPPAEAAEAAQVAVAVPSDPDRVVEERPRPVVVDDALIRSTARQLLAEQQQPDTLTDLDLIVRDALALGVPAPSEVRRVTAETLLGNGPGAPAVPGPPPPQCPPTARACIDVDGKRAWMLEGGQVTYGPVPITTGKPGYETARGIHRVLRHVRHDHSRIFDSPMPYSTYFTTSGMAFHEGRLDEPSHGCIHLGHHAAAHFFDGLRVGDEVVAF